MLHNKYTKLILVVIKIGYKTTNLSHDACLILTARRNMVYKIEQYTLKSPGLTVKKHELTRERYNRDNLHKTLSTPDDGKGGGGGHVSIMDLKFVYKN